MTQTQKTIAAQMTGWEIRKNAETGEEERIVTGVLAEEAPDRDGEKMDYAASKGYFQAWNKMFAEKTAGKSVGNLRAMHRPIAAGKFIDMVYDDDAKKVFVTAKVTDDKEWSNVEEGVYTGFSIRAKVVGKKAKDPTDGTLKYVADPFEGSLVDLPAMYGATFTQKLADGTVKQAKLKGGVAKLKLTVENVQKLISDANLALLEMTQPEETRKGFYTISWFANVCDQLNCLAQATTYERDDEQDGSTIPEDIKALAKQLGLLLVKYVQEEVAEAAGEPAPPPEPVEVVVVEEAAGAKKVAASEEANLPGMRKKTAAAVPDIEKKGAKHSKETKAAFKELRDQTKGILERIETLLADDAEETPGAAAEEIAAAAGGARTEPPTKTAVVDKITIGVKEHEDLVAKAARTVQLEGELQTIKVEVEKLAKRTIPTPVKINAAAHVVSKGKDTGENGDESPEKPKTAFDAIKLAQQNPGVRLGQ